MTVVYIEVGDGFIPRWGMLCCHRSAGQSPEAQNKFWYKGITFVSTTVNNICGLATCYQNVVIRALRRLDPVLSAAWSVWRGTLLPFNFSLGPQLDGVYYPPWVSPSVRYYSCFDPDQNFRCCIFWGNGFCYYSQPFIWMVLWLFSSVLSPQADRPWLMRVGNLT